MTGPTLTIGLIADIHASPVVFDETLQATCSYHNEYALRDALKLYEQALDRCVDAPVDLIVLLGDLSHLGDPESALAVLERCARTGISSFVVAGNHDCLLASDVIRAAVTEIASPAVHYLDAEREMISGRLRLVGVPVEAGELPSTGRLAGPVRVPEWGEELVVICSHYSLMSTVARMRDSGFKHPGDLEGLDALTRLLQERTGPTVVVHGHVHARDAWFEGNVLQLSCAALVEPPFELTFLTIDVSQRPRLTRRSISLRPSPGLTLPVLAPPDGAWTATERGWQMQNGSA
jgi:predicted phosphodiesterase